MGLTTWKGDVVRKGDVTVAKNYLSESEILELNRIVVMFLDYAEDQATRRKQVFLDDWTTKLDEFLRFNERQVLPVRPENKVFPLADIDSRQRLTFEAIKLIWGQA